MLRVLRVGWLIALVGGCAFDLRIPDRSDAPVSDRWVRDAARDVAIDARSAEVRPDRAVDRWPAHDGGADVQSPLIVAWQLASNTGTFLLTCGVVPHPTTGGVDCKDEGGILVSGAVKYGYYGMCSGNATPDELFVACATQAPISGPCNLPGDLVGGGCACGAPMRGSYPAGNTWVCDCGASTLNSPETWCIPGAGVSQVAGAGSTASCPPGQLAIGGGCQGTTAILKSVPGPGSGPTYAGWLCEFANGVSGNAFVLCLQPPP